jgi:hypothetical protein
MDENDTDHEGGLLYVKSTCLVCLHRTYTLGCPYCDGQGKTYIQASDTIIGEWVKNLDEERKNEILNYISTGCKNGKKKRKRKK